MGSRYHLFKAKGRENWYYYYLDESGAKIKKTTGERLKRDAEAFLEALVAEDERLEAQAAAHRARFRLVADPMFLEDAAHLKRWERKNRTYSDTTRAQHRRWLDLYILPRWGDTWLDEIKGPAIEDWLAELHGVGQSARRSAPAAEYASKPLSSSTRNAIAATFTLVLEEALRYEYIDRVPVIELDARNSRRKDALLDTELEALFPEDADALAAMWARPYKRLRDKEDAEVSLMFGAMFCLMVSAGLRPGEARGMNVDQLYLDLGGLIVDRAVDDEGKIGPPKKSRRGDPRFRVAYVPEKTWRILALWTGKRKDPQVEKYKGLLFPYRGAPVGAGYILDRFQFGLQNAGVSTAGRILSPHSCRYTYDTKMKAVLSRDVLQEFIGHRSDAMTDHYDRATLRPALEARLLQLEGERPNVEGFWRINKL